MSKLNPQQQKAVETTECPLLVIAGPGSGKTHTLVERVFHHPIDRTIDEVSAIVGKIENKEFIQDPAKRCAHLCDKCDLKHFCNR